MSEKFDPIQPGEATREMKRESVRQSKEHDTSWEQYQEALNFPIETLKGKKVLDIGGRPGGKFARKAKELEVDLVTLNPELSELRPSPVHTVAGLSQELPFADESFDFVIALASVPIYLPKFAEDIRKSSMEIIRVLKIPGGAIITPITEDIRSSENFKRIVEEIAGKARILFRSGGTILGKQPGDEPQKVYQLVIMK